MKITINQNENQNIKIENRNIQTIGINNTNDNQLITLNSNLNNQNIGINQNENQVIFIDDGGIAIGINDVLVNGVSVVSNNIAYVIVPTKTSELENDSGFITTETDPTVPSYIKTISLADINNWNNKQNALVSGTNIKTINNESLLGSGNINIEGTIYSAGTGINIENNIINNEITSYNDLSDLPTIPTKTSDLINDSDFINEDELAEVAFTGSYNSLSDTPIIPDSTSDLINDSDFITSQEVSTEIQTAISTKQDTLVSGSNIKTINNTSLLGSGNINISSGTSTDVQINGTSIVSNNVADIITKSAYNSKTNKIVTETDINNIAKTNIDNEFSYIQTIPSIELTNIQPYIDFHYNNDTSVDYTSRIIEISSGTLNIPGNLNINGNLTNNGTSLQSSLDFKLEDSGTTTGSSITFTPSESSGIWIIIAQIWGAVNDNAGIYIINPITGSFTNVNTIINSNYINVTYSGGTITINKTGGNSLNYKIIRLITSTSG